MNKIVYITIAAIWLIVFSVVLLGVLVAPDLDVLGSLQKYKVVGQQFLDKKPIDLAPLKGDDEDSKFVYAYGRYMKAMQNSENLYNAENRLFLVSIEPEKLANSQLFESAYTRLGNLMTQTKLSYDLVVDAQKDMISTIKKLDKKELKIYAPAIEEAIAELEGNELEFIEKLTQARVALEKYYRAILDFAFQRQGMITASGSYIQFQSPEDQQYYEQLIAGKKTYEQEILTLITDYQEDLRKNNSDIPVDIK